MNYVNQMVFFQNAYRIAFVIAVLALILAVILFFVFDIRTIFLIKTGLAQRKTVQEMGERNSRTGKLREDPGDETAARTKAKTTRKTKRETVGVLNQAFGVQKPINSQEPVHEESSAVPHSAGFQSGGSGYGVKNHSSVLFKITQKTIITHTDEQIAI